MASDQTAALMLDAAVAGVIDFGQARLRDSKWWRKSRLILEAFSRQVQGRVDSARLAYYTGLLANGRLTDESFEKIQNSSRECYHAIAGSLQPWIGQEHKNRKAREFQDARQAYIDSFGVDPHDPEFKKWEAAQIEAIRIADAAAQVETDEEKLKARLIERDRQGGRKRRHGGKRGVR